MGRSLLAKLSALCFSIFALLFLLFNLAGREYLTDHLIAEKKGQLTNYSQYIKEHHFAAATESNSIYNLQSISREIEKTDAILNVRTWIATQNGYLLLDSQNETLQENTIRVTDYDPAYFGSYYHVNKTLSSLLPEPMLSVILPVSSGFQIKGYIVVHYPMEQLQQDVNGYLTFGNLILLGIGFLFILLLFFCWFFFIRPTKQMLTYATQTNSGNYQQAPTVKRNDELGTLQHELIYMSEKIQHLDDYQKTFVANVSHDFRSPLTSIKGYAEAMLDGTIPPELHEKYLDVIVFEVERLTKLTTNLLSLNQFEQGAYHLDITSFDINQVIKRTATSFEGTCIKKHIKVKLIFSERETYVNADKERIQQVLYNLLDNAIKFSNRDSEIHIKTIEKKEKVQISVKDFGIGIPKDGLKKIWERFYKTDLSRGKDKKGTGLGLSITKEIIASHNENINVTSTEGAGTEFTFTLPLTTPNE